MIDKKLSEEYKEQGGSKHTKKSIIYRIISEYEHDYEAEGNAISKRRLWYILKPLFAKSVMPIRKSKGEYIRVDAITNHDYSKFYNELADDGTIDDTYIADNSRELSAGEHLPHIIIAPEKATIATTAKNLALSLGCSYYISSGQSSIYGAKKLLEMIDNSGFVSENIIILTLTDHDKSGHSISTNIGKHFGVEEYRTLLTPEQIPPEKVDDYFDVWDDGSRAYELDILNIHQLQDVFLNAIPEHIADDIKAKHEALKLEEVKDEEVNDKMQKDEELKELYKKYRDLERQIIRKQSKLREKFEIIYDEADPTTVYDFELHSIVDESIKHETLEW